MAGVNKVILIANLGKDPEVRYTQNGTAVTNLRVAVGEKRKNQDGKWEDHTEWISVVAFGKTAEMCGQYLAKGRQVYVEGKLQTRKYQAKDGTEKYSTEVIANNVTFLSGDGGKQANQNNKSKPAEQSDAFEEDLPF